MAKVNKGTVALGWCDNGNTDGKFTEGMVSIALQAPANGIEITHSMRVQGNQIGRQRQVLFDYWADQIKTDWLLWVDSDIVMDIHVLTKVWDAADKIGKPVVTGFIQEAGINIPESVLTTASTPAEPAYDPNWRAEINEKYYMLRFYGIDSAYDQRRSHDDDYYITNNYYRSYEEAERIGIPKRDKALALARIEKFIYANGLHLPSDQDDDGNSAWHVSRSRHGCKYSVDSVKYDFPGNRWETRHADKRT